MNPARSFGTAVISATTLGSDVASHGFYGHWVRAKYNFFFEKITIIGLWSNYFANIQLTTYLQVYWIGPILGGITAALIYQMLFRVVPLEDKKEYTEVPLKDVKDNEA